MAFLQPLLLSLWPPDQHTFCSFSTSSAGYLTPYHIHMLCRIWIIVHYRGCRNSCPMCENRELLESVRQAPLCTECDVTREPFSWFVHVVCNMTGGSQVRSLCTQPAVLICNNQLVGARSGAVGWGTALQTGRSRARFPMVSLKFFIDIILPAALWPWGRLSLVEKWVPGIFTWG